MADGKNVYVQIEGRVSALQQMRNGSEYAAVEVLQRGSTYPDRVTVWGVDNLGIVTGDQVKVKGWLSWKREEKGDKTYFNVSLNEPVLVERTAAAPAAAGDGWTPAGTTSDGVWR